MDFFAEYEKQMADMPEPDQWERVSIATEASYWSAVRSGDALARAGECCREMVRLIDEAKREFLLNLPPQ